MSSIVSEALPASAESPPATWKDEGIGPVLRRQRSPQLFLAPSGLEIRIPIRQLDDLVKARRSGRLLAKQSGYSGSRVALVLTAISELARNILAYAQTGEIILSRTDSADCAGILVVAKDHGPGIADLSTALEGSGQTTAHNGRGLNSLRLCMDHFHIESRPGVGTQVTCEVLAS